jgi:hypothetical protein
MQIVTLAGVAPRGLMIPTTRNAGNEMPESSCYGEASGQRLRAQATSFEAHLLLKASPAVAEFK